MPRFEAGNHVGKAAVQIQMCGQLPQPVRGGSRRRGRFNHSKAIVERPLNLGTPVHTRIPAANMTAFW
jgi:hypothetical protein